MANTRQTHGKTYGNRMAHACKRVANVWQTRSKREANAWQTHGPPKQTHDKWTVVIFLDSKAVREIGFNNRSQASGVDAQTTPQRNLHRSGFAAIVQQPHG